MIKRLLISFAFIAFLTNLFISNASSEEKIFISVVPFHAPEKIWHLYSPFVDYLNKNTDIKWELKIYPNHDAIKEALCSNEISIALFGPILVYETHKECGATPLITALNDNGKVNFKVAIVSVDPKIKSLKDLKGHKVGLFKPQAVANWVTKKMLDDEGLNEGNVEFIVFQSLERILNEILTGSIKAGGVREMTLKTFRNFNFNILKISEPLPGFAFMASPHISQDVRKKFINALLKLKPLKNKTDMSTVKMWDETIKYGFSSPPKDYMQEVNKYYILYSKYAQ
jgi:ABC-type phosphate/phosphonate transport system substrate-binding protein